MKVKPLHDRILVSRLDFETKTAGGLHIPDNAQEKPTKAKVIAVGNGRVLEDGTIRPLDVKAGDTILFGKYSGTELTLDGEKYLIMNESDVLAIVDSK